MNGLNYTLHPNLYNPIGQLVIHVSNIGSKETLFKQLNEKLHFPEYFGNNWDALYDCLTDFHWINQKGIVLVHDDIPELSKSELTIYMNLLSDAILDWENDETHFFEVVFPIMAQRMLSQ